MKPSLLLTSLFLSLPAIVPAGEWVNLFNGKDLEGWTARAEVETLEAVHGEIHLLSTENVWVISDLSMNDFEVELEVLLPDDAAETKLNTGLAFRLHGETGKPKGYQCEIEAPSPGQNGAVYGIGLGGWLYPENGKGAAFDQSISGVIKDGDWNTYKVVCQGPSITTYVNGKQISAFEDSQQLEGYFGIQHHGKGGMIRFRNVRARELPSPSPATAGSDQPNILWITAEDMSPTLGAYGDTYATTPNLDAFAKESVRYTNAFAAAPVCSPSRSTLITGMWAASTGTSQMRSAFHLPGEVKGFPSYLREAGYFTSNAVKTDYNTGDIDRLIRESWTAISPEAHWRDAKRENGQPFFSVFNQMLSHQSRTAVWPYEAFQEHVQSSLSATEIHNPDKAPIPPYYPDTAAVRKTVARFYDCVSVMDQQVGRILSELEDDGLADDTIVFFYSDHGSGMPRHKRLLHDSGMKVPLMVRFPEKYQHLAPAEPGQTIDRLVTFVDLPKTVLSLAGLEAPEYMQGDIFLGEASAEPADYVYGFRDRVDEAFDCSRSVRSTDYLYIRNYLPHLSWNQPSVFSDLAEIRQEITRYASEHGDTLTVAQRGYAGPFKAFEEFYDVSADPENINNLALGELTTEQQLAIDAHRAELKRMRMEILDVGILPESIMADYINEEDAPIRDITTGKTNHRPDLESVWAAADLVGFGTREELLSLTESGDDAVRFWGIIGLRYAFPNDESLLEELYDFMDDISPDVRIEMAHWMADASEIHRGDALKVLLAELDNPHWWTALRACRSIELLGEKAKSLRLFMKRLYRETRHASGDENFFIAFSAGAYLNKLGEKTEPWDFTPAAGSFSADPEPEEDVEP
ncbi:MAG: sulfatase-like hydrolase/transferase [Verrucomicrobiales bacterium]|nr:sulfatase-like hydrolase/transferase [Verrucomicrobiales bacterium]